MKAKNKKKLILSLIKDDLINTKLVNRLNEIGLHSDDYSLHLSETVLKLMGFKDNEMREAVFERYIELADRARSKSRKGMNDLALEIYFEIKSRKSCD